MSAPRLIFLYFGTFPLLPFYVGETILVKPFPFSVMSFVWASVLAIVISIGSLALWNNGNRIVGPQRAAVFVSLMPVFGSILAMTFLGEELYLYHIGGAFLICAGQDLALFLSFMCTSFFCFCAHLPKP